MIDQFFLTASAQGHVKCWTDYEGGCEIERVDATVVLFFGGGTRHLTANISEMSDERKFRQCYISERVFENVPQFGPTEWMDIEEVVSFDISRPWELPWPQTKHGERQAEVLQRSALLRVEAYARAGLPVVNPREILRCPDRHCKYLRPIWSHMIEILQKST